MNRGIVQREPRSLAGRAAKPPAVFLPERFFGFSCQFSDLSEGQGNAWSSAVPCARGSDPPARFGGLQAEMAF